MNYILTPAADGDIDEILRYTLRTHGMAQVEKYLKELHECIERIASGEVISKTYPDKRYNLRQHHCHKHMIFFGQSSGRTIIYSVLHERMDFINRLKGRL